MGLSPKNRMTLDDLRASGWPNRSHEVPATAPCPVAAVEQRAALTKRAPAAGGNPATTHKYSAQPTEGPSPVGRMIFDSKLGARLAEKLEQERAAGVIAGWAPEVSLIYGLLEEDGKVKRMRHRVDALVIHEIFADGSARVSFQEAKGRDLSAGRAKRAAVSAVYGLKIKIVKAGGL